MLENGYRGRSDPKIGYYNAGFRPVMEQHARSEFVAERE